MEPFDQPQYLQPAHRGCDSDLLNTTGMINGEPIIDAMVLDSFYVFFIAIMRLGKLLDLRKERLRTTIQDDGSGADRE